MLPTLEELGIDKLSADDRVALAAVILESVTREVDQTPITPAQMAELERRLADSKARPDDVVPWEVVKAEALTRIRK